jgi:predicted branched-subunit amino acid permease
MSLALSQRMGQRIGFLPRLAIAFFNTDEIFALAMAREVPLTVPFMLGLGTLPILGWTLGTLCGALAGSILHNLGAFAVLLNSSRILRADGDK